MFRDGWLDFGVGDVAERARRLEARGYDALWAPEAGHDPLLTLTAVAAATETALLGTGIVVAFGRSPMTTAVMANDLQLLSRGRLLLGLGSQIKPHIEKRYSMPWSHPAARMREYVLALRAIWESWEHGTPLRFRGEFYRHTLMTPFFSPGPNPFGSPRVYLAAVGERMTEVAGEVADGLLLHPFTTERYVREVTLPALERGLAKSGRDRSSIEIAYSGMVVTGANDEARARVRDEVRAQLAFYASTPAYRGVLALHERDDVYEKLNELSRAGKWELMPSLIDDDLIKIFSVDAPVDQIAPTVRKRFGGLVDRFSTYATPSLTSEIQWEAVKTL